MELAMQDVLDRYFEDDELLQRVVQNFVENFSEIDNDLKSKDVKIELDKYISPVYEIQKLFINFYKPITFSTNEDDIIEEDIKNFEDVPHYKYSEIDIKLYELVFTDYEDLKFDNVLSIVTGFKDFLYEIQLHDSEISEILNSVYNKILMNKNLPDDIKLWAQMQ